MSFDLSRHLYFAAAGHESKLPVSFSESTGNPTRYRKGVEATLTYKSMRDERMAAAEDEKLDLPLDQAFGPVLDATFDLLDSRT